MKDTSLFFPTSGTPNDASDDGECIDFGEVGKTKIPAFLQPRPTRAMSLPDSSAFHRGKEARKNGKPCMITDGRLMASARADWFSGWCHQNALMMPPPSEAEIAQNNDFLRSLAAEVRSNE